MSLSLCFLGLNVLCFYAFKDFKCLMLLCYKTPMSSILCFVGLQGPLFDVTGLQRPFAFFDWHLIEKLDRSNEISVSIFTYLIFLIKHK